MHTALPPLDWPARASRLRIRLARLSGGGCPLRSLRRSLLPALNALGARALVRSGFDLHLSDEGAFVLTVLALVVALAGQAARRLGDALLQKARGGAVHIEDAEAHLHLDVRALGFDLLLRVFVARIRILRLLPPESAHACQPDELRLHPGDVRIPQHRVNSRPPIPHRRQEIPSRREHAAHLHGPDARLLRRRRAGAGAGAGAAPPKKPRIGPVEMSSVLSSARDFLSAMRDRGPTVDSVLGDPDIARVKPELVRLAGVSALRRQQAEDSDSGDEDAEEEVEPEGPHVEMEVSLGVFDVHGSTAGLLQKGVPEASGRLPGESDDESEDSEDEGPLIREVEVEPGADEGSGAEGVEGGEEAAAEGAQGASAAAESGEPDPEP
mmetsp:Transcript_162129/g.519911  ORF Transcript_162129/g.519911 Transcript_162129/m.519911 type:complete len:382 (-) Transcript_162129:218-1363(-)